jgi:hypothetical protein
MANDRLVVGIIFICLAPSPAKLLADLIEHEKNMLAGPDGTIDGIANSAGSDIRAGSGNLNRTISGISA